jgi:malate dehydrogenase (oxaloacetate-decarboxylating)
MRIVKKPLRSLRVVVTGVGAAGTATIKILQSAACDIVGVDEPGASTRPYQGHGLYEALGGDEHQPPADQGAGSATPCTGPDVFIQAWVPGILSVRDVKRMARDPIVFAMPIGAGISGASGACGSWRPAARTIPTPINNVLCFPGFSRLLGSRPHRQRRHEVAARALAACVRRSELSAEYIIPSVFNKSVAPAVATGVARAAWDTGSARRRRRYDVSVIQ